MKGFLLLLVSIGLVATATASQVRIQSPSPNTPYLGLRADGSSLTLAPARSVRFAAGIFDDTFQSSLPLGDWLGHFTPALASDAAWGVTGPTTGRFNSVSPELSNAFDGRQGFIFGTVTVDSRVSEWIVFTSPAWIFPRFNPLDLPTDADIWNVGSAGTTALVGSLLNVTSSGNGGFQFAAIPEPAAYAIVIGIGSILMAGIRRRLARS